MAPAAITTFPPRSKAPLIGAVLNGAFVVGEASYDSVAHSLSLLMDAERKLGDVRDLGGAWLAAPLGRRPPAGCFTYGFRRSIILAARADAAILMLVTGAIAAEAIHRLLAPQLNAGLLIAVNGFTVWLFASGREHDLNWCDAFAHMAADALVALGVLVSGVLIICPACSGSTPSPASPSAP